MKRILPAMLAFGLLGAMTGQTLAESCFDLWDGAQHHLRRQWLLLLD